MGTLSLTSTTVAFSDATATGGSDPLLKHFDWKRSIQVSINNPESRHLSLESAGTEVVFNGTRTITLDGTTQLTVTLSPLNSSCYRFTYASGTLPGFRTSRSFSLSGKAVTIVANTNGTATWSTSSTAFSAVQAGDILFVPGTSTGDTASLFNSSNEGFWTVLVASSTSVTLLRSGDTSEGVSEVVTPADNKVQAFTSSGVQVGDTVDVSAGFSVLAQKSFTVSTVTATWFEVISTSPLPLQTATPGATGVAFYTKCKKFIRIESDQEVVARVNGDSTDICRITPWSSGDSRYVGEYTKVGPVWSLTIYNRSTTIANVLLISVE